MPQFTATYDASPQSIVAVRNEMAALAVECGLDESAIADVKLAVSEAATNAFVHGYRQGDGIIRVEATITDGELVIWVCDEGRGMQPRPDSPGLGLGLPVIAQVAKRLEIHDGGPGTRLQMTFGCPYSRVPDPPVLH
jgi:anti-sigma regulatory factor (Ser/Thr protein kinase)